jgi:hypothetical protein
MRFDMKKFTALVLVFSILVLSGNLYAAKKGAEIVVTKTDGTQVKGELITVKEMSLLLLSESGSDVSFDVASIKDVRIVKKSRALEGAGLGLLAGVLGGFVGWEAWSWAPQDTKTKYRVVGYAGVISCAVGLGIGALVGEDKTIQIEGKSDSEIQESLEYLRKKARIKNYQ